MATSSLENSTASKTQSYIGIDELANMESGHFALSGIKASTNKMLKVSDVTFDGQPLKLKIDTWQRIVYEPSVYNGTGEEERKNIVLEITPEIEQALATMEDTVRQSLNETISKIDSIWCSAIKPATIFNGPTLRAKIRVSGKQHCNWFDASNTVTDVPLVFKGLEAKTVLHVQGVYIQKQAAGMILNLTHMQTRPTQVIEDLESPF